MVNYKKPKTVIQSKPVEENKNTNFYDEIFSLVDNYKENTESKIKFIDCYLAIVMVIGVINFIYCVLFMPKPFHIFISSFVSCVGSFALGVCLRMQLDSQSENSFPQITHRKALFDFVLAHIVLHAVVTNYMG